MLTSKDLPETYRNVHSKDAENGRTAIFSEDPKKVLAGKTSSQVWSRARKCPPSEVSQTHTHVQRHTDTHTCTQTHRHTYTDTQTQTVRHVHCYNETTKALSQQVNLSEHDTIHIKLCPRGPQTSMLTLSLPFNIKGPLKHAHFYLMCRITRQYHV